MFGVSNIVKIVVKVYSAYGIAFDGAGSWDFGNEDARNVVIFGVNSS